MLDREDSADSAAVDDILKTVKEQIAPLDDSTDTQSPEAVRQDEKDVAALLSGIDFQSILDESLSDDEVSPPEGGQTFPENPAGTALPGQSAGGSDKGLVDDGEERSAAFSKVLGSYKQAHSYSGQGAAQRDTPESGFATGQVSGSAAADRASRAAERPYAGRRPEQVKKPAEPKRRTWWGATRQTLWLLLILLACIIFFRIFGPERKEPTFEDYFRPGNPDIEFLDAINFLEKYYERQRKQKSVIGCKHVVEAPAGSLQPSQPVDDTDAEYLGQVPDNSTSRNPFSPASGESTP